ncbi:MAG: NUDIX domain-containing protein [Candidatus Pacebacteria bacterium]|nr:NUDIX domain-containing protein [Candidatus Paceibacterota bacterium]
MEYLDILDEKGNKTGEIKSKDEAHQMGLWHRTVHVWFMNSQKELLLQYRSKNKKNYPNTWDISVAGHVSSGEDPITSALREISEEIGLEITADKLEVIGDIHQRVVINNGTYIDSEYNTIYLVRADLDIGQLKMQKSEVGDLRWISISEFRKWVAEGKKVVPHDEEYKLLFNILSA